MAYQVRKLHFQELHLARLLVSAVMKNSHGGGLAPAASWSSSPGAHRPAIEQRLRPAAPPAMAPSMPPIKPPMAIPTTGNRAPVLFVQRLRDEQWCKDDLQTIGTEAPLFPWQLEAGLAEGLASQRDAEHQRMVQHGDQ